MYRVSGTVAATAASMQTRRATSAALPALRTLLRLQTPAASASASARWLCSGRALGAVDPTQGADTNAPPAAAATSGTGFGPKRVTASRVPVSKRAQRAAEAAAVAAATKAATQTPAPATPAAAAAPDATNKPLDVDAAFRAFRPHDEVTGAAPPAAAASPTAATGAAAAPTAKLSPTELAAQFPHSRNLSAHQPPSVASDNPFVHDRWFLSAEAEALPPQPLPPGQPLPECYITRASQLPELCKYLSRTDIVALDTEFASQGRYRPKLELIQLATPELLVAVDVSLLRGEAAFKDTMRLLYSKEWIVHSHRGDLEVMYELAASLGLESRTPAALFDTQIAYAFLSTQPSIGYAALMADLMGVAVDKSATLSDWSMRPLTTVQISYAINDVKFLFQARDILTRRLRLSTDTQSALKLLPSQLQRSEAALAAAASTPGSGREAWFQEEMQLLVNPLLYEAQDPALVYTGLTFALKKLQSDPVGLSVFRALAAWREQRSRTADQPVQWLLTTDQLQSMSLSPPTTLEQLAKVASIKKVVLMQHGNEIVRLVNSVLQAATAATEHKMNGAATAAAATSAPSADGDSAPAAGAPAPDAASAPTPTPAAFTLPTLSLGHRDASRLKWDMFSLMSSLIESRSRSVQVSPFVLAPRRDLLDMASLSLPSIRAAAQWRSEGVGARGDAQADSLAKDALPASFQSSLLPSAVNYRFATVTEDSTFDRLLANEDVEDSAEEGQADGNGATEAEAEAEAEAGAGAPAAALPTPVVAGEVVMLSTKEELQLLSRSKLLRGWRRALIGNDVLRITEGEPVAWQWNAPDGADGKGFLQFLKQLGKKN